MCQLQFADIWFNVIVVDMCRNRIRMYPAFVNCTTIDWFHEWPQDALLEVADRYLYDMSFDVEDGVSLLLLAWLAL